MVLMTRRPLGRRAEGEPEADSGRLPAVKAGAGFGVAIGGLLAGWATVVRLLGGSDSFSELNTSYPLVVLTYLGSGVCAGALVGLLGRYVSGRWSAACLGFGLAIPCGLAFATAMGNMPPWTLDDIVVTLLFAVTLGAGVGYQYWRIFAGEI
jgi:hypothetical protein